MASNEELWIEWEKKNCCCLFYLCLWLITSNWSCQKLIFQLIGETKTCLLAKSLITLCWKLHPFFWKKGMNNWRNILIFINCSRKNCCWNWNNCCPQLLLQIKTNKICLKSKLFLHKKCWELLILPDAKNFFLWYPLINCLWGCIILRKSFNCLVLGGN